MAYPLALDEYVPKYIIENKTCTEMVLSIRESLGYGDHEGELFDASLLDYAICLACTSSEIECPQGKSFAKEVRSFLVDAFKMRSATEMRTVSTPKKLVEKFGGGRNWVDGNLIQRLIDLYKMEAKEEAKTDRKEKRKNDRSAKKSTSFWIMKKIAK